MNEEKDNLHEDASNLKDLTEEVEWSSDPMKRRSWKKKFVMLVSLLLLSVLFACGCYLLLGETRLQVKTTHNPTEKIPSGADLQKAAFDSLKGSLNSSAPGSANESPSPTPTTESSEKTKAPAPIQSGVAMTIAPPPEAQYGRSQKAVDAGNQTNQMMNTNAVSASSTASSAKPKVGSTLTLAALPARISSKSNDAPAVKFESGKPILKPARAKSAPGFGAMLPVRLMGVLYTLRAGSMVRLELARDLQSEDWTLKRGTVFVGAVLGGELDRAYVQIKGFINPDTQGFVRLEGEMLGNDGGAGLRGKRRRIASAWGKIFDRVAQSGTQILTGVLGRQGSSVIVATDPYGIYRSTNGADSSQSNRSFVEVPAGEVGFVLITALPEAEKTDSYLASRKNPNDQSESLPDAELAQLLAEADPAQIRASLPRMNPELRRVAEMVLREIEIGNK